jgi:hypothetical protein
VKSTSCHENTFTITLDHSGQSLNFQSQGFPVGFSDTHWWGRDHFTPCFHVVGLRAMVHYKPSSDKSFTGDLLNVGFRDDLPAPSSTGTTTAEREN